MLGRLIEEWVVVLSHSPRAFEAPCGEEENPKTFILPLSACSNPNVQLGSSPLRMPSLQGWQASANTQNVVPCLLLKSSAETEQPRDWVWGRMEAVGEGRSQCVRLCTCICERVCMLRALQRSRPRGIWFSNSASPVLGLQWLQISLEISRKQNSQGQLVSW